MYHLLLWISGIWHLKQCSLKLARVEIETLYSSNNSVANIDSTILFSGNISNIWRKSGHRRNCQDIKQLQAKKEGTRAFFIAFVPFSGERGITVKLRSILHSDPLNGRHQRKQCGLRPSLFHSYASCKASFTAASKWKMPSMGHCFLWREEKSGFRTLSGGYN